MKRWSHSEEKASAGRRPGPRSEWCEHLYPLLVSSTETGRHYARCPGCVAVGPERPTAEAARQALLVLGLGASGKYEGG